MSPFHIFMILLYVLLTRIDSGGWGGEVRLRLLSPLLLWRFWWTWHVFSFLLLLFFSSENWFLNGRRNLFLLTSLLRPPSQCRIDEHAASSFKSDFLAFLLGPQLSPSPRYAQMMMKPLLKILIFCGIGPPTLTFKCFEIYPAFRLWNVLLLLPTRVWRCRYCSFSQSFQPRFGFWDWIFVRCVYNELIGIRWVGCSTF